MSAVEDEPHEDVCLNCGRYFFWTDAVVEANASLGRGSQRCLRCATLDSCEVKPVINKPRYNLPPSGSTIRLLRKPPASYTTEGETYKIFYRRQRGGYIADVHVTRTSGEHAGAGTFDRASSWEHARWELLETKRIEEDETTPGEHWTWKENDFTQNGLTRFWLFGTGGIVEYTMHVEDCDGDFANWCVKQDRALIVQGMADDIKAAQNALRVAANDILGYDHFKEVR